MYCIRTCRRISQSSSSTCNILSRPTVQSEILPNSICLLQQLYNSNGMNKKQQMHFLTIFFCHKKCVLFSFNCCCLIFIIFVFFPFIPLSFVLKNNYYNNNNEKRITKADQDSAHLTNKWGDQAVRHAHTHTKRYHFH